MSKKLLITQSNYIPWKGYFDAIRQVDALVLYDEMQYTKRDWRNRNKIKTPNGLQWLSIPVKVKGKYHQKINETEVSDQKWRAKHWNSIQHSYKKAPYFEEYAAAFQQIYEDEQTKLLSAINFQFIQKIMEILKIDTPIYWSKDFELRGDKTEKLLNLCKDLDATDYYSGSAAKNYMQVDLFEEAGVHVHWLDYSNYPEYPQLYGEFEHGVSVLDLLFNVGDQAPNYLKHHL